MKRVEVIGGILAEPYILKYEQDPFEEEIVEIRIEDIQSDGDDLSEEDYRTEHIGSCPSPEDNTKQEKCNEESDSNTYVNTGHKIKGDSESDCEIIESLEESEKSDGNDDSSNIICGTDSNGEAVINYHYQDCEVVDPNVYLNKILEARLQEIPINSSGLSLSLANCGQSNLNYQADVASKQQEIPKKPNSPIKESLKNNSVCMEEKKEYKTSVSGSYPLTNSGSSMLFSLLTCNEDNSKNNELKKQQKTQDSLKGNNPIIIPVGGNKEDHHKQVNNINRKKIKSPPRKSKSKYARGSSLLFSMLSHGNKSISKKKLQHTQESQKEKFVTIPIERPEKNCQQSVKIIKEKEKKQPQRSKKQVEVQKSLDVPGVNRNFTKVFQKHIDNIITQNQQFLKNLNNYKGNPQAHNLLKNISRKNIESRGNTRLPQDVQEGSLENDSILQMSLKKNLGKNAKNNKNFPNEGFYQADKTVQKPFLKSNIPQMQGKGMCEKEIVVLDSDEDSQENAFIRKNSNFVQRKKTTIVTIEDLEEQEKTDDIKNRLQQKSIGNVTTAPKSDNSKISENNQVDNVENSRISSGSLLQIYPKIDYKHFKKSALSSKNVPAAKISEILTVQTPQVINRNIKEMEPNKSSGEEFAVLDSEKGSKENTAVSKVYTQRERVTSHPIEDLVKNRKKEVINANRNFSKQEETNTQASTYKPDDKNILGKKPSETMEAPNSDSINQPEENKLKPLENLIILFLTSHQKTAPIHTLPNSPISTNLKGIKSNIKPGEEIIVLDSDEDIEENVVARNKKVVFQEEKTTYSSIGTFVENRKEGIGNKGNSLPEQERTSEQDKISEKPNESLIQEVSDSSDLLKNRTESEKGALQQVPTNNGILFNLPILQGENGMTNKRKNDASQDLREEVICEKRAKKNDPAEDERCVLNSCSNDESHEILREKEKERELTKNSNSMGKNVDVINLGTTNNLIANEDLLNIDTNASSQKEAAENSKSMVSNVGVISLGTKNLNNDKVLLNIDTNTSLEEIHAENRHSIDTNVDNINVGSNNLNNGTVTINLEKNKNNQVIDSNKSQRGIKIITNVLIRNMNGGPKLLVEHLTNDSNERGTNEMQVHKEFKGTTTDQVAKELVKDGCSVNREIKNGTKVEGNLLETQKKSSERQEKEHKQRVPELPCDKPKVKRKNNFEDPFYCSSDDNESDEDNVSNGSQEIDDRLTKQHVGQEVFDSSSPEDEAPS